MQNLISYLECVLRFNVSSTIIVLFQFQKKSTKNSKKLKISKTVNFTKKVQGTKKMQNLILHQTCSINFSVSSTILLIFQKIRFLGGHLVNINMAATDICANANIDFLSPQTIPFPKIYSFANLQKNFTQNIRGRTNTMGHNSWQLFVQLLKV